MLLWLVCTGTFLVINLPSNLFCCFCRFDFSKVNLYSSVSCILRYQEAVVDVMDFFYYYYG